MGSRPRDAPTAATARWARASQPRSSTTCRPGPRPLPDIDFENQVDGDKLKAWLARVHESSPRGRRRGCAPERMQERGRDAEEGSAAVGVRQGDRSRGSATSEGAFLFRRSLCCSSIPFRRRRSAGPFWRGMWSTWTCGGSIGGWGSEEAERGRERGGKEKELVFSFFSFFVLTFSLSLVLSFCSFFLQFPFFQSLSLASIRKRKEGKE